MFKRGFENIIMIPISACQVCPFFDYVSTLLHEYVSTLLMVSGSRPPFHRRLSEVGSFLRVLGTVSTSSMFDRQDLAT